MSLQHIEFAKTLGDFAAIATFWAVLAGVITALASLFTLIWTIMRIYEMYIGVPFHTSPFGVWLKSKFK